MHLSPPSGEISNETRYELLNPNPEAKRRKSGNVSPNPTPQIYYLLIYPALVQEANITDEDFATGTHLAGSPEVVPGLHHETGRALNGYEEPR